MNKKSLPVISLAMRWERAQALQQAGDMAGAARELMALLERDPERCEAWQALASVYAGQGLEYAAGECQRMAQILSGQPTPQDAPLAQAYRLVQQGQAAQALPLIQTATTIGQGQPFVAMLEAWATWQAGQIEQACSLCRSALYYWPLTVHLHLIMVRCLTAQGDEERAVDHIRLVRSLDPEGEVAMRHGEWVRKDSHPAGMNVTVSPSPLQHGLADETVEIMRETLDQLVSTLRPPSRPLRSLKPFHAILSAHEPLTRLCGDNALVVERAMADLAATVTRYDGIASEAILVDDAGSLAPFGLGPVSSCEAISIKRLLDGLADVLDLRGFQLTSVLIVGGDAIIPFYRLPNPTEDPDAEVPTDAPYACHNDGELIPDRLVGRMLHSERGATDMLLLQLGTALQARLNASRSTRALKAGLHTPRLFDWLIGKRPSSEPVRSFGYAASVWRRAAQHVFSVIGPAQALRLAPPLGRAEAAALLNQIRPRLAYFNLHGLPDSPHWYGQRDPQFAADYPPFPVALSPADINYPAEVVFTAACYGIPMAGREATTSIALRWMQNGTWALVGSTTIAYGGLDKPLVGVDLLGQLFWEQIVAGRSAGEALRQAKIGFVNQMQQRQGYLDGEDQKTLASFILLGDPLLAPLASDRTALPLEKQTVAHVPLLCVNGLCRRARINIPEEQLVQVRQYVAHTLPEMAQARVQNSGFKVQDSEFKVVSLSTILPYGDRQGVQVVRVTLDRAGKIIKLAMSK